MEFLVRKAGLSIFLQDQVERSEKRILEVISENQEVLRLLGEIKSNKEKLIALDEEIKTSDQVQLLQEIIYRAKIENNDISVGFQGLTIRLANPIDVLYKAIRNIMR
ncbi:hypothetical protein [Paenibacillus sp. sgz500958]